MGPAPVLQGWWKSQPGLQRLEVVAIKHARNDGKWWENDGKMMETWLKNDGTWEVKRLSDMSNGATACRRFPVRLRQDTSELDQNAIFELLPVAALEPFPGCSHVEAGPQWCGDYKKHTLNFSDWILDLYEILTLDPACSCTYIYIHNITWLLHAGPCSAYFLVSPLLNACSILREETIRLLSWNILAPSYCNGLYFKESCAHPTIGWLFVPGFNVLPGALNGFNHYKWCTMVDIWWLMV